MKVGLQTWGTDGDFMPFLALAIGLKQAGHQVTIAYTSVDGKDYSSRKDVQGIELLKADGGISQPSNVNPYAIASKPGSFREYSKLLDLYFEPYTDAMYSASEKLCQECDLVIGHAVCFTLLTASRKYNCPRVSLVLTPLVVRSNYVSPIGVNLGKTLNSFLWWAGGMVATNSWFKKAKSLHKLQGLSSINSLQKELFTSDILTIVGASETLVPKPIDWSRKVQMTGFLNLTSSGIHLELPNGLEEFLSEREPPVYMTFGSCMQYDLEASTKLLVEAAKLSGKRTIIQSNWANLKIETGENIFRVEQAPHNLIFPRCASILHHGGAGTTQSALLAGKPSIVIPHGFDQMYWANHLFDQGVAAEPIPKNVATPHEIAGHIKWLNAAEHIQEKASDIGKQMQNENGVQHAVKLIETL